VTLISGTADVAVKIGVGDKVAEGVAVGTSGVDVASGEGEISGVGVMPATAVCVAPETMVDIIAVPRKLRSCVGAGRLGIQACVRINKTDKRIRLDFRMKCLLSVIKAIQSPKGGALRHRRDVRFVGFVPDSALLR
jgi:hypothetical protein